MVGCYHKRAFIFRETVACKKVVLKNFTKFTWGLFFNKEAYNFIKKETLEEEVSFHLESKLLLRRSKFLLKLLEIYVLKPCFFEKQKIFKS